MPRDLSIRRVFIIGSGPIVIGQACEFDYSGTQACKALREEGVEIVLLNSNPATIMTDPELTDRTYIEPITPEVVDQILEAEARRGTPVDSMLPTLGGQTALNTAMQAAEAGVLERHGVRLIGAQRDTIQRAEDRQVFKETMIEAGVDVPRSGTASSLAEAHDVLAFVGLPTVIRPAYTLGGSGGGMAFTREQFDRIVTDGLTQSPIRQVLVEESLIGWKEFELEMMRDRHDNVVVVCSIENLDPMGVHTGDSITVAPALTLSDREYQAMRDAAIRIMRAVGVETGGANIQFAVDPATGRMVVIEMNPRVSRSSALASKATGFPIAKIATKLAIGYTLDEIRNDITRETPACFEPSIDYCVVKLPRFAFEKFPEADETLTTSMKSVGEAMAIGRTFREALQKCIRSLEIRRPGYGLYRDDRWLQGIRSGTWTEATDSDAWIDAAAALETPAEPPIGGTTQTEAPADWKEQSTEDWPIPDEVLHHKLSTPCQGRLFYIRYALKLGWSVEQIHSLSRIDRWFLDQLAELVGFERRLLACRPRSGAPPTLTSEMLALLPEAKSWGYSDAQLAQVWGVEPAAFRQAGLPRPSYRLVDTCAAEFEAYTPYYYSTHEKPLVRIVENPGAVEALRRFQRSGGRTGAGPALAELGVESPSRYRVLDHEHVLVEFSDDELRITDKPKVVVIGGGPNRIGQGIEFDYCCVHASAAAREMGYETVMINSNPETVSTDYDTSDLLFFEPLTHEDVLNICERLHGGTFHGPGSASAVPGRLRGVIVQFGGQTPLNLAAGLGRAGVPILGTSTDNVHLAEDREQFSRALNELGLRQPPSGIAFSSREAVQAAERIGYPVLVRPSYVLGGRGMQVCNHREDLLRYIELALRATDRDTGIDAQHPILVDKFLLEAIEIDVDAISDYGYPGRADGQCDICGVMEHIEEAGIHSGDSSCVLPPYSLAPSLVDELKHQVKLLARRLEVCGLMNVQFAVQDRTVFILEVNPRASRTIPFVSKATGVPWAKIATQVMLGKSLDQGLREIGRRDVAHPRHVSVKVPVFPFKRFPGADVVLGPEMRSTGEVMGIDATHPAAFAKALEAAGMRIPTSGRVLVSVNDADKPHVASIARDLMELGFEIFSTRGTHDVLAASGVPSRLVYKSEDQEGPFLRDLIERRELDLLINTPLHTGSASEEGRWRAASIQLGIPLITTLAGARAVVGAIHSIRAGALGVRALQDYLKEGATA